PFRSAEFFDLLTSFSGNHLKTDFKILFDLQNVHQIPKAVFKQDRKNMAVSVQVTVSSADYADFSDA
ncbi:MAG: hypothetical protein U9N47_02555, partial [Thermodesulfobacteriota bacterium]|nr:hypothetical protein [Thermodesulfobacteriota bacterium]